MADNWQLKAVLSANAESMLKTLKMVNQATRTTRKYLMDVGQSGVNLAARVGMPLGLISGALAAFSVAGVKAAVTSFAELGDQVVKSASRLGISTDEYQRLKYVAGQSGVSVEELGVSMGKLNLNIGQVANGDNKNLAELFNRVGISVRKSNGEIKTSTELLPEIAHQFSENKGAAEHALLGAALFGKGWKALEPLLSSGKKGLEELNERYEFLDLTINNKALKDGEAFGDQMEDLKHKVSNYGSVISSELIPVFSPLVKEATEWLVVNRDLVTVPISKFIKDMAKELSNVDWSGVIKGVGDFIVGMRSFIQSIGGAKNALIALAVVMNAQTLVALASLIASVTRAGWAFLVMAANAYIAGNASLLSLLRVAAVALFVAGPIGALGAAFAWLGGMAASAGGLLSGAMGLATAAVRGLGLALMANPLGVIIGIATAAYLIYKNWDTLKAWFSSFFDWIGEKFQVFLGWAKSLADLVGGMFSGGSLSTTLPNGGAGNSSNRPSLAGANQQQVGGKFTFDFRNAPPGMQLAGMETQGKTDVDMNVGTRGYALD